ncbi:MAG: hypothetical protein IT436_13545 [Phycisphaerales bacterium]|nr:hypothetical protein [Phycisphaerales bacterium]
MDPDCPNDGTVPHVPATTPCDTTTFESDCFAAYGERWNTAVLGRGPGESQGFPLNLDLFSGLGPGDYSPRSLDPAAASYAVLASESGALRGLSTFSERPVLADCVDLVTGVPLVQQTDFELPFGGAIFRHTRTYSEVPATNDPYGNFLTKEPGAFWDWQGLGWMMSENPVFLIDAAYRDVVGPHARVCYFIPDAHHAIPFEFNPENGQYTAPARFDARLDHNGSWEYDDTSAEYDQGRWVTRPTKFWVYLQRGSLVYTITPVYEDVVTPENTLSIDPPYVSAHTHPASGTLADALERHGMPYYGLVDSIRDRNGNIAKMYYCTFRQSDFTEHPGDPGSTGCKPCKQHCTEKGQLKAVELVIGAETENEQVVWTLLYIHRQFDQDGGNDPDLNPYYFQNALQSIYVYDHPVEHESFDCFTVPGTAFLVKPTTPATPIDHISEIDAVDVLDIVGLGEHRDWIYEVRYLYTEATTSAYLTYDPSPQAYTEWTDACEGYSGGPRLLKTTITRRTTASASSSTSVSVSLNRYRAADPLYVHAGVQLKSVHGAATIANIVAADTTDDTFENKANKLLGLTDEAPVDILDPLTGAGSEVELRDTADLVLMSNTGVGFAESELCDQMLGDNVPLDPSRLVDMTDYGVNAVVKRHGDAGGWYRVYRLLQWPSHLTAHEPEGSYVHYGPYVWYPIMRSNYHHPYWFSEFTWSSPPPLGAGEARWITIVDDFGRDSNWTSISSSPSTSLIPRTRRVIQMNAAGQILKDKTWTYSKDGSGTVTSDQGIAEERVYDSEGRLIERRTKGWGSFENVDRETNGLIYVFGYGGSSKEPSQVAIKQGTEGGDVTLRTFTRDSDRPELVTQEVTNTGGTATEEVTYSYTFVTPTGEQADRKRIESKSTIRSAAAKEPAGSTYYAVTKEWFNDSGQLVWKGYGTLASPSTPGSAGDEFYLDYTGYDDQGRVTVEVIDANPASPPSQVGTWSLPVPSGWGRLQPAGLPALSYVTTYEYTSRGLAEVTYPNGRKDVIKYASQAVGDKVLELQMYFRSIFDGPSGFNPLAMGAINYFSGDQMETSQQVIWDPGGHSEPLGTEEFTVESEIKPKYDSSGSLAGASQVAGGDELSVSVIADPFGGVTRRRSPDGTITREVNNRRGQVERVYRGTLDGDTYWGSVTAGPDDMVLTEKRYYGHGVNDAHELVAVRTLRDKPTDQYEYITNEDSLGWMTIVGYDWRMREVWRQRQDGSGQALAHTVTFFDRANRPRFVATYGDTAPSGGSADPRAATSSTELPSASTILAATPVPLSLTETIYNARGHVEEERTYNTTNPTSGAYLVTKRYYDHAGRPVCVIGPGGAMDTYAYDAKGRKVVHKQFAGSNEVQRSEIQYDSDDNAISVVTRDRLHNASGTSLVDSNSVKGFTFNWYDPANRVVATAVIGASSPDSGTYANTFTNGSADISRPADPPTWLTSPPGYDKSGLRGSAQITLFEYDDAGRLFHVRGPNGSVTVNRYDGLGRLILKTENFEGTGEDRVQTAYLYENGQLVKIAAVLAGHGFGIEGDVNWDATDGTLQVTRIEYGADIVDADGSTVISENKGLVGAVHYPRKDSGQPRDNPDLTFRYYSDGFLATRTDARGIVLTYSYNELGQLVETAVDDDAWFTGSFYDPIGRVSRIVYTYNDDNRLQNVAAYTGGGTEILAAVRLEYDRLGNLITEWQQHGDTVATATSPRVDYDWTFSGSSALNLKRLTTMTYPVRPGTSARRAVELHYGDDGTGIDSVLNRITRFRVDSTTDVAQYEYTGSGRRVTALFGSGVAQSVFDSSAGVTGYTRMDRQGRTTDLNYVSGSTTRHRYQYGYDDSGNKLFSRVTHATSSTGSHDNDRSFLYAYDKLERLLSAGYGSLNSTNTAILPSTTPVPRISTWSLDRLGNWTGQDSPTSVPGLTISADFDGVPSTAETRTIDHGVFKDNSINSVTVDSTTTTPAYDPSGNLVTDGEFYYQYDAWSRLIQVNQAGTLTFGADGRVSGGTGGPIVGRYEYDGLGRLARRFCPAAIGWQSGGATPVGLRIEGYYYDGVRRIQEAFTGPHFIPSEEESGELEPIDDDPIPVGEPQGWCDREYVWGPGDKGLDELIVQYDRYGVAYYALNDRSANLMGVTVSNGQVVAQYTYDAYGQILTAEAIGNSLPADFRVGFQSLFFDRNVAASESLSGGAARSMVVGGRGVSQARNRVYHAGVGRFLQRDPNATGQPVLGNGNIEFHGLAAVVAAISPNLGLTYDDGMNLYEYLGGNPVNRSDPMGLSWDPFDDAFSIAAEHLQSGLGLVALAKQYSWENVRRIRAYERGGLAFLDMVWDRDVGILFDMIGGPFFSTICFEAGTPVLLADGSTPAIESVSLGAAVVSTRDPNSVALPHNSADPDVHDQIDPDTWRTVEMRLQDAQRGTVRVTLLRPLDWFLTTGVRTGSQFTLALTELGISGTARVVNIGPCPAVQTPVGGGQVVTGTFVTERAEIVRVWLKGSTEPIGATPSHPFYSEDRAGWIAASKLREGESVRTLAGCAQVSRIELVAEPTTVYNVEVHRLHTYYVGDQRLWVHNACFTAERGVFNERLLGATIRADYVRRGTTLELFNVAAKGEIGMRTWLQIRDYVAAIARREGFRRLIIEGVRGDSGRIVSFVIDL